MANVEARRGLTNPRLVTGGTPHTETRKVNPANAEVWYPGQLVDAAVNGYVTHASAVQTSFLGVCMSYLPAPSTAPSSQVDEVQVITDLKNTLWDLQLSTTTVGQAIIGANVPLNNITAVSAATKQSRMNGGTPVATAEELNIVGFVTDAKNEIASANPRVTVKFNDSALYHIYNTSIGI